MAATLPDLGRAIPPSERESRRDGADDITPEALQGYVSMVERGELEIRRGPVWRFDQLREAHRAMDENRANGKMVVVVP